LKGWVEMNTGSAKTCLDTGWMTLERRLNKLSNDVNSLVSGDGFNSDVTFNGVSDEMVYLSKLSGTFAVQLVHFSSRLEAIRKEFDIN